MTDEEIAAMATLERETFQAGYLAAMVEVNNKLFSIRQDHRVRLECEANKLKEWLDEQVKKGGA